MAKKSPLKLATDAVKEQLEELAGVKCPVEEYLEALEDVQNHVEASIEAAKEDLKRMGRG